MQIDLDIIPQFEAASDGVVGALVTGPGGFGIPELIFFLATYVWEMTGGEEGVSAAGALF